MKIAKKLTSSLVAMSIIFSNTSFVFALKDEVRIPSRSIYTHEKIIGKDRYETGRMTVEESKRFKNLILVNGKKEKLVDGLCASALIDKLDATILPINPERIDKLSMNYISNAKNVYIIGENQAIPYAFEKRIPKSVNVKRIGGKDRFETSEKIAKYLGNYKKAYVVNGITGQPDAMSISPVAAKEKSPVILTRKNTMEVEKVPGVEYTIIGGNEAISSSVQNEYLARRIGGETRYETNRNILNKYYPNSSIRYFTNGETLVDALSADSLSKNDGITFINRYKNHDLLEYIDTVQVGGFPYEIIFVEEGSGGTITPKPEPPKPEPPKPEPPKPENHKPTKPEFVVDKVGQDFDNENKTTVSFKISKESTDEDNDSITYIFIDEDKKEKEVTKYGWSGKYSEGEHTVYLKAVDSKGASSDEYELTFKVEKAKNNELTNPEAKATVKMRYDNSDESSVEFNITKPSTNTEGNSDDITYEYRYKIAGSDEFIKAPDKYIIGDHVVQVRAKNSKNQTSDWVDIPFRVPDRVNLVSGYDFRKLVKQMDKIETVSEIKFELNENINYAGKTIELSTDKDKSIKAYIDNGILHVSSKDIIYAGESVNGMFYFKEWDDVDKNIKKIDLTNFNTSNTKNMSSMFVKLSKLTSVNVENLNTENVTTMRSMFQECENLSNIDVSNFDTKNVTTMYGMFALCKNLSSIDVSNFNTENVTTMYGMFDSCMSLETVDVSGFYTPNLTDMSGMFYKCYLIDNLLFEKIITNNVTDMSGMFAGCENLKTINLSKFNVVNTKGMSQMFEGCKSLKTLDLSSFDTSKKTRNEAFSINSMFKDCINLETVKLPNLDTTHVYEKGMKFMFMRCHSLETIEGIEKFKTDKITDMQYMFYNCKKLKNLDLSGWDTSKVEYISEMFQGCANLSGNITLRNKEIGVSGFSCRDTFLDCSTEKGTKFTVNYKNGCYALAEKAKKSKSSNSKVYIGTEIK